MQTIAGAEHGAAAAPPLDLESERARISAFLAGASLELSSRNPEEIDACAGLLEPGTAVYISFPPGQTYTAPSLSPLGSRVPDFGLSRTSRPGASQAAKRFTITSPGSRARRVSTARS